MALSRFTIASMIALTGSAKMQCPGSGAWISHASMEITALASASCADVYAEILARAGAQNGWVDPHNGGIYSVLSSVTGSSVTTQRTTNPKTSVGGQLYTDKQIFTLSEQDGKCTIEACSESQGTSVGDMSTNYCDIRNLYCGSADGCTSAVKDFSSSEQSSKPSVGAGHDFSNCVVKKEVEADEAIAAFSFNISSPDDSTCAIPGNCGYAYQGCCAGFAAKGYACGCSLADGDGKAGSDCGTCGTVYTVCCAAYKAKGFPCTCDISSGGASFVV